MGTKNDTPHGVESGRLHPMFDLGPKRDSLSVYRDDLWKKSEPRAIDYLLQRRLPYQADPTGSQNPKHIRENRGMVVQVVHDRRHQRAVEASRLQRQLFAIPFDPGDQSLAVLRARLVEHLARSVQSHGFAARPFRQKSRPSPRAAAQLDQTFPFP